MSEKDNIEELDDERKALAIQELVEQIRSLTEASRDAVQNLNRLKGERAMLDGSGGVAGFVARSIQDSIIRKERRRAAGIYSDLQDARVRMVNLTGSRITGFRRRRGESATDAAIRLGGQRAEYVEALNAANAAGATAGRDFIGRQRVDAAASRFARNPNAPRYSAPEPPEEDLAVAYLKRLFGGRMQYFTAKGGEYFKMAVPMMRGMKPMFGPGGFRGMAGVSAALRGLGPAGAAASAAIGLVRQYWGFNRRRAEKANAFFNTAKLSGLDVATLGSLGTSLGAYGGDMKGAARFTGGIAATLGGLRYGGGWGSLETLMKIKGLDVSGTNGRDLATTEEILVRMSEIFQRSSQMEREELAYLAKSAGIDETMVRAMETGPDVFARKMQQYRATAALLGSDEIRRTAEEASLATTRLQQDWDLLTQRFMSSWFMKGVGEILHDLATPGMVLADERIAKNKSRVDELRLKESRQGLSFMESSELLFGEQNIESDRLYKAVMKKYGWLGGFIPAGLRGAFADPDYGDMNGASPRIIPATAAIPPANESTTNNYGDTERSATISIQTMEVNGVQNTQRFMEEMQIRANELIQSRTRVSDMLDAQYVE